jgi:hypothetical protein
MPSRSSRQSRDFAGGLLVALSHFAVLPLLAGCTLVPEGFPEAPRAFSQEHFCPLDRVAAVEVDTTPRAPPVIARDPERFAMWRRHFAPDYWARHRVLVRGCAEGQQYSCWRFGAEVPNARYGGTHRETIGASCTPDPKWQDDARGPDGLVSRSPPP